MPRPHLRKVLQFIRNKKDQISGFGHDDNYSDFKKDVYTMFVSALKSSKDLPADILEQIIEAEANHQSRWEQLVEEKKSSFSFAFDDNSDDDDN